MKEIEARIQELEEKVAELEEAGSPTDSNWPKVAVIAVIWLAAVALCFTPGGAANFKEITGGAVTATIAAFFFL